MQTNNNSEVPSGNSKAITHNHDNANNQYNYYYSYLNNDLIADEQNSIVVSNNYEEWNWNFNEIDSEFDIEMNNEFDFDSSSFFKSLGGQKSKREDKQHSELTRLIESTSQTFDLLQSAADLLNDSNNTTFQFDTELLDLEDNYFIETSTPTEHSLEFDLNLNDYVSISDKKRGFLKYIGKVHFANGLFCGIELDEAEGRHDGQIDNIRYFQCKQNHGIFAPIEKIKLSNQSDQYQFKPIKSEDILNDYKMIDNNSESLSNTDLNMSSNSNTSSLSRLSFQLKVNRFNNNNKIDQSPTTIPTVTTTHSSASKLVGVFKPICTNNASDTNMSQAQSDQKKLLASKLKPPSFTKYSPQISVTTPAHCNSNRNSMQTNVNQNIANESNSPATTAANVTAVTASALTYNKQTNRLIKPADHVSNKTNDLSKLKMNLMKNNFKLNETTNQTNLTSSTSSSSSSVNLVSGKKSPNTSPVRRNPSQQPVAKTKLAISNSMKSSAIPSLAAVRNSFQNNDSSKIAARISAPNSSFNSIATGGGCSVLSSASINTNQHNFTSNQQNTKNEQINKSTSLIKTKVFQPAKLQSTIPVNTTTTNIINKTDEINLKKPTKLSIKSVTTPTPINSLNSVSSVTNSMSSIQKQSNKSTQIMNLNQTNNKLNETFDLDDLNETATTNKMDTTKEPLNSLLNFIDIQKTNKTNLFQNLDEQRRRSILIENNFDFSAGVSSSSSSSVITTSQNIKTKQTDDDDDDFLENELIPDDLLDEMHSFIEATNSLINSEEKQLQENLLNEINLLDTVNNTNNEINKTMTTNELTYNTNNNTTNINECLITVDKDVEQVLDILIEKLCQSNNLITNKCAESNERHMMKDKLLVSNDKQSALNQIADDYDAINKQKIEIGELQQQEVELIAAVVESESELVDLEEEESDLEDDEHLLNKTFDLNETIEATTNDMQNKMSLKQSVDITNKKLQDEKNRIPTKTTIPTVRQRVSVPNVTKLKKATNNENTTTKSTSKTQDSLKKTIPLIQEQTPGSNTTLTTSNIIKNPRKLIKSVNSKTNKTIETASNSTPATKDDELNVFEADNQTNTTCSSDNDDCKSTKSNQMKLVSSASKTRGKQINRIINELNTAVNTSTTQSSPGSLSVIETKSTSSMNSTGLISNSFVSPQTAPVNASTTSISPPDSVPTNNNTFNSSVNSTSSRLNKPNYSLSAQRITTVKQLKQHSNNKENQEGKMPKSLAFNKIYKSRDGLAAVSSNTSIMSEVSNISKSSLPSSIPTPSMMRQTNVSSSSTSAKRPIEPRAQQTPLLLQSKQFQQEQQKNLSSSSTNRLQAPSSTTTTTTKQQLQQLSSNSRTHFGTTALSNHTNNLENVRKSSVIPSNDSINKNLLNKKPGPLIGRQNENSTTLSVSTNNQTNSSSTSPTSVKMNKNELKLNNQIKHLEALCESRTKELTLLKLKLRDTLISFDAIAVAFKYLSNDLNGFEVTNLRSKLNIAKRQHNELVKTLKLEIFDKETRLKTIQTELETLTLESNETKQRLETELKNMSDEHKTQMDLNRLEHDLTITNLKQEKELIIKRLNKQIETMKNENEKLVFELNEQLKSKQNENLDLINRIKECEETLSKDKDERIQRLIETQRTLEKEIESLKAALDIKNSDLFDLRTRNNELTTKLEGFNELNIKCRRYKQELEQANAILANKQEAEKQASENNRMLAMKIEVKNRENQRLSMQNEQLQFRLQSHPNLSINTNGDTSFNTSNVSINQYDDHEPNNSKCKRASTMREPSYHDSSMDNQVDQVNMSSNSSSQTVKLRSKSFKTNQSIENSNKKHYSRPSHQYRPVSEMYDININDRDTLMTRSYTTASTSCRTHIVDNEDNLDTAIDVPSARCESSSSSSSISHLDSNSHSEDQMTKSCMGLKENESVDKLEETLNQNISKNFFSKNSNDNSLSSSSSVSINEHSVIILD